MSAVLFIFPLKTTNICDLYVLSLVVIVAMAEAKVVVVAMVVVHCGVISNC